MLGAVLVAADMVYGRATPKGDKAVEFKGEPSPPSMPEHGTVRLYESSNGNLALLDENGKIYTIHEDEYGNLVFPSEIGNVTIWSYPMAAHTLD